MAFAPADSSLRFALRVLTVPVPFAVDCPLVASLTSIIIVNWNGSALLKACLESIQSQTFRNFETIVVDNGSSDDSLAMVRESFPQVRLVALDENTGFARGNNLGLAGAHGDFIALVNNDVVLDPAWLASMVAAIEKEPGIGICASKLIRADNGLIDSVGDFFTTAFCVARPGEGSRADLHSENRIVPGACAAAVLYRRAMIDEIGFLDEDFFLNHEDTDLNLRALLAGWKCMFVHDAVAFHHVSSSVGVLSDTAVYYSARNSLWVWLKNLPGPLLLRYLPHRIIYELASCLAYCVLQRKWRPYLRGKCASLQGFPRTIAKRRTEQKHVVLKRVELQALLMPLLPYLWKQFRRERRNSEAGNPAAVVDDSLDEGR